MTTRPPFTYVLQTPLPATAWTTIGPATHDLPVRSGPSDEDLRMLRDTYMHCRRWAHAGQVGTNAVTLLAALDELLERRAREREE